MELGAAAFILFLLLLLLGLGWLGPGRGGGKGLPPGPRPWPLLGNLGQGLEPLYETYRRLWRQHGAVFTVWTGPRPAVVLCGHRALRLALLDHAEAMAGRPHIPAQHLVSRGYGLVGTGGERWRQLRRFTLSALRDLGVSRRGMETRVQEAAQRLARDWHRRRGRPFDPQPDLSRAVCGVLGSLLFGPDFDPEDPATREFLQLTEAYIRFFRSPAAQRYNAFPGLLRWLPGQHRRALREDTRVQAFIRARIDAHRRRPAPPAPQDFLDCYLRRQEQERGKADTEFGDENLVALVRSLFRAGTETTINTLQFSLLVLCKYPDVQARMRQELDVAVGRSRAPGADDRARLPYVLAVLHELQRYLDLVPGALPHATTQPLDLCKHHLPQGTTVIPLLTSAHFEEGVWETPEDFNPGHFLDEKGAFCKREEAMPFSIGKRACPGEGLARLELLLFTTTLLQSLELEPAGPPDTIDLRALRRAFRGSSLAFQLRARPRPL